jgi:two-component system, OmpR family, sensor histidine kinase QseC
VTISAGGGGGRWTVEDSGPGLSEADQARLGERFFRAGATQDQSGSGLGWSIVRRIAVAGGLHITLGRSAELGGLSVQVDWPAA